MFRAIRNAAESDSRLAGLYDKAEEYAAIYRMARERQKGCDGLGELNNLKDELRAVFEEMLEYCRQAGLLSTCDLLDIDNLIEGFGKRVENRRASPQEACPD